MTTHHVAPHINPNAPTMQRPQMTFIPQDGPVALPVASSPTWKTGWVVSGVAAILAIASLGVVGALAVDRLARSDVAPGPASTSAPVAPPSGGAVAPVPPAPVVTVYPAAPVPAPIANAPRIVVIPAPAAPPVANEDPVVTPSDPVAAPQKPPVGIGTCDLVACDPKPAPPPPGIPKCGDLVACTPIHPAPGIPKCGDLVACTPLPQASRP